MKEAELQVAVIETAGHLGWRIHHQRPGRTRTGWRSSIIGNPGFPDLCMVRPPQLLFVELKAERGRVSHDQAGWLNALGMVGKACPLVQQQVWRPADWQLGVVEAMLR